MNNNPPSYHPARNIGLQVTPWRPAAHLIDTDGDQQMSRAEFDTAYGIGGPDLIVARLLLGCSRVFVACYKYSGFSTVCAALRRRGTLSQTMSVVAHLLLSCAYGLWLDRQRSQ